MKEAWFRVWALGVLQEIRGDALPFVRGLGFRVQCVGFGAVFGVGEKVSETIIIILLYTASGGSTGFIRFRSVSGFRVQAEFRCVSL